MLNDSRRHHPLCAVALIAVLLIPAFAWSQDVTAPVTPLTTVAPAVSTDASPALQQFDMGMTAWMLMSSALVLFMVPGLALFYGGMVRAKNVLNMFLCCMVAIGVIGLHWVILGYAITFGGTSLLTVGEGSPAWSLLGWDPTLLFLRAFDPTNFGRSVLSGDTVNSISTHVPELAFVMFQGKFAIITPALIVGALAERIRFGPFVLFMVIWSTIVYCPVAHWVWNVNGWLFQWGVMDYAGGTVVHVLAGVSALAVCLVVGPRRGYGRVPMPPHSLGLTLIGAGLLWFGWFGFNAGSTIAIPGQELPNFAAIAALAFTNTQIAAAAAATAWMIAEWLHGGKPTILGFASGMVAGLVVITPCAGHVEVYWAMLIGAIGGFVCYFGCRLKNLFKYDDSLDAFGVHGIGGALGAVLVGVFAFRPVTGMIHPDGDAFQVVKQLVGMLTCAAFAFILSYIIALIIHKTIGLRVTEEQEFDGLDVSLHGESGYNLTEPIGAYVQGDEGHPDARGTSPAMSR